MGLVADILGFIGQREQAGLEKEQWAIKKEQMDTAMKQQKMIMEGMEKSIVSGLITREQASDILLNPKGIGATLHSLSQWSLPKQQEPPPATFEQTGEAFRPTQEMLPKPTLTGQIANQQLFGGMNLQDMAMDMIKKETGIGESIEPVQTKEMYNPVTKQNQMGQVLRNGQTRWLSDSTGNPLIVPPEVEWKPMVIGNQTVEIGYDKKGNVIQQNGMPLIRGNIPQNQQILRGLAGGPTGQAGIPIPPSGFPAGTILPEAVKPEAVQMTGPKGEQSTTFVNPLAPGKGGLQGIPTKPPQAVPVTEASKRSDIEDGVNSLLKIKDLVFNKDGSINRTNLFNAQNIIPGQKGIPRTKGKMIADFVYSVIDPIQRARTGAVINPNEEASYRSSYGVHYMQNDEQLRATWAKTINYLNTFVSQLDPNEAWVKDLQKKFSEAANIPGRKGGMNIPKLNPYQKMSNEELLKQLGK